VTADQRGAPLAVVVTSANTHDMKAATTTLDSLTVRRHRPTPEDPQHLCLDKGYDFPEIEASARKRHYTSHLRHRGECVPQQRRHPARRWVAERTGAWHNRFRKPLIRFEKRDGELSRAGALCNVPSSVYRMIVGGDQMNAEHTQEIKREPVKATGTKSCPNCSSRRIQFTATVPPSSEGMTWRCNDCAHTWVQ
jgi:putative transposase